MELKGDDNRILIIVEKIKSSRFRNRVDFAKYYVKRDLQH